MFLKRNKEEGKKLYIKEVIDSISYMSHNEPIYFTRGKYYTFISHRAYWSWGMTPVVVSGLPPIHQEEGGRLGFRDGSLIQNAKDGKIYLISGAKRRLLTAPMGDYGFDYSQVIEVSDAEIQFHVEGESI